jgi:hypothetical protein
MKKCIKTENNKSYFINSYDTFIKYGNRKNLKFSKSFSLINSLQSTSIPRAVKYLKLIELNTTSYKNLNLVNNLENLTLRVKSLEIIHNKLLSISFIFDLPYQITSLKVNLKNVKTLLLYNIIVNSTITFPNNIENLSMVNIPTTNELINLINFPNNLKSLSINTEGSINMIQLYSKVGSTLENLVVTQINTDINGIKLFTNLLKLSFSITTSIPTDMFSSFTRLETLSLLTGLNNLSNNTVLPSTVKTLILFGSVDMGKFTDLSNIESISFSYFNTIQNIQLLTNITELFINIGALTTFDVDAFLALNLNLTKLGLGFTIISNDDLIRFVNSYTNLKTLILNDLKLESLNNFNLPITLEELNININPNIKKVDLSELINLKILDISNCGKNIFMNSILPKSLLKLQISHDNIFPNINYSGLKISLS